MLLTVLISAVVSVIFGTIEVMWESKVRRLRHLATWPFAIYSVVLAMSNVTAALVAFSFILTKKAPPEWPIPLSAFIAALVGTAGFHGLVKNVSITTWGKGMPEAAIKKARFSAVEATSESAAKWEQRRIHRLADSLRAHADLNNLVLTYLGTGQVAALDKEATKSGADLNLHKAYALASQKTEVCEGLIAVKKGGG